jgi:hypothetical protein
MALQKVPVNINFQNGLNTKIDPFQLPAGQFLSLQNSVFTTGNQLMKRNGFGPLVNSTADFLTTFGGNLTAIGSTLSAYAAGSESLISKGTFVPIDLNVLPVARSAVNQVQCDSVIASNNFACTVYTENNNGVLSYKYDVCDSTTGQYIQNPTTIPVGSGAISGSPRVFLLGGYFVIAFPNTISGTVHLQYIALSVQNPTVIVKTNTDMAPAIIYSSTVNWDAVVAGSQMFFAYNTTSGGQQIEVNYLDQSLSLGTATAFAASIATIMSVSADTSTSSTVIYASFWDAASSTGFVVAVNSQLQKLMTATEWLASGTIANVASVAQNGIVTIAYENVHAYSYDSAIGSNFISRNTVTLPATVTTGTLGSPSVVARSVGLASKGFLVSGTMYLLTAYDGKSSTVAAFQPTYFLMSVAGNIVAKFAYQNGGGYLTTGLPQAQVVGSTVNIAYLYKDLITSVNKTQGAVSAAGVYSQTGVNLAIIGFDSGALSVAEIGQNLNLSGGYLYAYDGQTITEQNFHLYPDSIEVSTSTSGGSLTAQQYFYQVIYQWTDAQGNIINSGISIPVSITTTGSTSTNTITGPYLRLTNKNNVKIVIYRWSAAQESYFQITSIAAPLLNSTTADSWSFTDTFSDSSIEGNGVIYTTGGVLENTGTSACKSLTLFDTRLWAISAEDQNLLLYSKQVADSTPVEMSDLLTYYVAPNAGAAASTGPAKCLAPMDDKLCIYKNEAIYYINGTGPDITGSNSGYPGSPIFITSAVGSNNQRSIVLMPNGLMSQSDKGIWLLGRDLSTNYIGAAVEAFNSNTVTSAFVIPATTQVRFTLDDNNTMLMYDYFYNQWGTFIDTDAVSSCIYNSLHTFVSSTGGIYQETPGTYLDNGSPVLLSFTTSWLNLAGLQGYMRAWALFLLGQYYTPHKLQISIAYNYNSSPSQTTLIIPTNFSSAAASPFGDQPSPFGAPNNVESWRVFLAKQRCTSVQISLNEIFDSTMGVQAGAGLTLSGMNLVVAMKKGWGSQSAAHSAGGGTNLG